MVMACPMIDWGLSGATTTTLPRSFTASTRFMIPGAVTPPSFVISITGLSLLLPVFFRAVFFAPFLEEEVGWFAIFRAKVFFFFGMSKLQSGKSFLYI